MNIMKRGFSRIRFQSIIAKEFIQIKKDPASLATALFLPVLLLVLLGYAMNEDVEHIDLAVWDDSQTEESRGLIQALTSQEDFNLIGYEYNGEDVEQLLDNGDVHAALIIPSDYANRIQTDQAQVQVLIDGSNPTYAQAALKRSEEILTHYALTIQNEELSRQGVGETALPLQFETQVLYNPNMESLEFNIPALIGLIMQEVTLILTAFALVREKEQGTMEQLIVTPIKPSE